MFLNEEIRIEIAKDLFVQWVDSNMNENLKEAEHEFMKFTFGTLGIKIIQTIHLDPTNNITLDYINYTHHWNYAWKIV